MAKYIISDIFKGDYRVSQLYKNNPAYYRQFGFNGHEGVDWATPVGVEILAPFKRNIIIQDQDVKSGAYGSYIVVWDPDQKCAVWYCHLDSNTVSVGKEYTQETVLGKTGNSGNTTGPHIHVNFVETDTNGARLNSSNDMKGMLNILDPNLVEWKLGGQPLPVPEQPVGTITIPQKTFEDLVGKSSKYDEFKNAGFDSIEKVKTELKSKQNTIDNLNQQINDRNNDITQLNAKLTTTEGQIVDLTSQRDSAIAQAQDYIQIKKERDELLNQKDLWIKQERNYKNQITKLTDINNDLKTGSVGKLAKAIFKTIFPFL